jgi:hypothetical protein
MLATRDSELGLQEAAVRHADEGLAVAEKVLAPDHPELAVQLLNHAEALRHVHGQEERALASLRRAQAIAEAHPGDNSVLAGTLVVMAKTLDALHRYREAVPIAARAVELFTGGTSPFNLAAAHEELGVAALGAGDEARGRGELAIARAGYLELGLKEAVAGVDARLAPAPRRRPR